MSRYDCGATWVDFSPETVRNLQEAWGHAQTSISYDSHSARYNIDLARGVHTNTATGTTRRIHRVFVSYPSLSQRHRMQCGSNDRVEVCTS